jgi:acetyl-CoA/propionyl-CoA carboxylase biotin carboxyl carrier protein
MTVPQAFDSLLAKLIVTGATRQQALERSRRALAEFEVGGMPTVLAFHRAVVRDEAFTGEPFSVHTRWIETEFAAQIPPFAPEADQEGAGAAAPGGAGERERIVVEVGGKRLDVVLPAGLGMTAGAAAGGAAGTGAAGPGAARPRPGRARKAAGAGGDALTSPMQGTIVKIVAEEGQRVSAGDTVVVLEAMKMEQPLTAHKDGTVTGLAVEIGQTVSAGTIICQLAD